jgi:hypothetical protein
MPVKLDDPKVSPGISEPEVDKGPDTKGPHIRCPRCGWKPGKHSGWMCTCRHIWNTFETGGICPACLYQWMITMCPSCKQWSAHSAWYAS